MGVSWGSPGGLPGVSWGSPGGLPGVSRGSPGGLSGVSRGSQKGGAPKGGAQKGRGPKPGQFFTGPKNFGLIFFSFCVGRGVLVSFIVEAFTAQTSLSFQRSPSFPVGHGDE